MTCPHQGKIAAVPAVSPPHAVALTAVLTMADQFSVAGCAFMIGNTPHPCIRVQWSAPSLSLKVGGAPALLSTSIGLCLAADQTPQGPAIVQPGQVKVVGS
jgi:hypothetical protein